MVFTFSSKDDAYAVASLFKVCGILVHNELNDLKPRASYTCGNYQNLYSDFHYRIAFSILKTEVIVKLFIQKCD